MLSHYLQDDRGVSPTLAAPILLAIVVLLGTVTGAVSMGLADSTMRQPAPTTSVEVQPENGGVTATHQGGSTISTETSDIYIVSDGTRTQIDSLIPGGTFTAGDSIHVPISVAAGDAIRLIVEDTDDTGGYVVASYEAPSSFEPTAPSGSVAISGSSSDSSSGSTSGTSGETSITSVSAYGAGGSSTASLSAPPMDSSRFHSVEAPTGLLASLGPANSLSPGEKLTVVVNTSGETAPIQDVYYEVNGLDIGKTPIPVTTDARSSGTFSGTNAITIPPTKGTGNYTVTAHVVLKDGTTLSKSTTVHLEMPGETSKTGGEPTANAITNFDVHTTRTVCLGIGMDCATPDPTQKVINFESSVGKLDAIKVRVSGPGFSKTLTESAFISHDGTYSASVKLPETKGTYTVTLVTAEKNGTNHAQGGDSETIRLAGFDEPPTSEPNPSAVTNFDVHPPRVTCFKLDGDCVPDDQQVITFESSIGQLDSVKVEISGSNFNKTLSGSDFISHEGTYEATVNLPRSNGPYTVTLVTAEKNGTNHAESSDSETVYDSSSGGGWKLPF